MRAVPIDVCCLDLAGTTVSDDGAVEEAFVAALRAVGIDRDDPNFAEIERYVRRTMGTSKIDVFNAFLDDPARAGAANAAFEGAYERLVSAGAVRPIPGAAEAISAIRASGVKVALLTGFSPKTRNALLSSLGWGAIADLALSPADVGRGRPAPDLVLAALIRLQASSTSSVAVCGDTASDMACARRAGAGIIAGVLTGMGDGEELVAAGATDVLDSVAELPGLLLT